MKIDKKTETIIHKLDETANLNNPYELIIIATLRNMLSKHCDKQSIANFMISAYEDIKKTPLPRPPNLKG